MREPGGWDRPVRGPTRSGRRQPKRGWDLRRLGTGPLPSTCSWTLHRATAAPSPRRHRRTGRLRPGSAPGGWSCPGPGSWEGLSSPGKPKTIALQRVSDGLVKQGIKALRRRPPVSQPSPGGTQSQSKCSQARAERDLSGTPKGALRAASGILDLDRPRPAQRLMPKVVAYAVVHQDPPRVFIAEDQDTLNWVLALRLIARTPGRKLPERPRDRLRQALRDEQWGEDVELWMQGITEVDV